MCSLLFEGDIVALLYEGDIVSLLYEGDIVSLLCEGDIGSFVYEGNIISLLYEGDIVVDDGVVVAYIVWYVAYHAQVPVWFIKQLCCLLNISSLLQHILTKIKKPINTSNKIKLRSKKVDKQSVIELLNQKATFNQTLRVSLL